MFEEYGAFNINDIFLKVTIEKAFVFITARHILLHKKLNLHFRNNE